MANNIGALKSLAAYMSNFPKGRSAAKHNMNVPVNQFGAWQPSDRSFTIDVPLGWKADGGTVDMGANGYLRIVQVMAPDGSAGLAGFYSPSYQYVQTGYGTGGVPPEPADSYVRGRFFHELSQRFNLNFQGLVLEQVSIDPETSQKLTRMLMDYAGRMGVSANVRMEAVSARGHYLFNGREFDLLVAGAMQYITMPLQGMGYSYVWGPAPIFVEVAPRGGMSRWIPIFERIAYSWQVSPQWLATHQRNAAADARGILAHYRKKSRMIHENAERRMNMGMEEWERRQNELTEETFDTFHALGGEDRYDNPETGEEVDVDSGADRYLYDSYSSTWIGLEDNGADSEEIMQNLKDNGFVELKRHTH